MNRGRQLKAAARFLSEADGMRSQRTSTMGPYRELALAVFPTRRLAAVGMSAPLGRGQLPRRIEHEPSRSAASGVLQGLGGWSQERFAVSLSLRPSTVP